MKKIYIFISTYYIIIPLSSNDTAWIGMSVKVEAFVEKDSYSKVTATGRRRYVSKWRAFGALVRPHWKLKLNLMPAH